MLDDDAKKLGYIDCWITEYVVLLYAVARNLVKRHSTARFFGFEIGR